MTRVRFLNAAGEFDAEVEARPGERLLDIGQNAGQPLEGTCEGQMACSTCHVLVTGWKGRPPPPPSEEEDDLLDFAHGVGRGSRLSCQLYTAGDVELIEVRMPGGSVDVSR